MGYVVLEGGAEFGGRMENPDRIALELAGGPDVPISIVPAAAAPDNNHRRAGQNGVRWFQSLGSTTVSVLPLIDKKSAGDPGVLDMIRQSKLIYLLGGFPHYLAQVLKGSDSWDAVKAVYQEGAVVAGSSAGAMVLCDYYYDPSEGRVWDGLGFVPGICVLPHHDTFGRRWAPSLARMIPETRLVGIDEETAMIDDGRQDNWRVYGKGAVTVYHGDKTLCYRSGEPFKIFNHL